MTLTVNITSTPINVSVVNEQIVVDLTTVPITVSLATVGPQGPSGEGVPAGGTAGQILAKASSADYDTHWITESGGTGTPGTLAGYDGSGNPADVTVGSGLNLTENVLTATGGSSPYYTWAEATTSVTALLDYAYVANNASVVVITLPVSATQFAKLKVVGKGAGGWRIAQNAGQTIHFESANTTTGASGSLTSQNFFDAIELVCITANTDWIVMSVVGNITVT